MLRLWSKWNSIYGRRIVVYCHSKEELKSRCIWKESAFIQKRLLVDRDHRYLTSGKIGKCNAARLLRSSGSAQCFRATLEFDRALR